MRNIKFNQIFLSSSRTAAEWALKNGACVRFVGYPSLFCDYNSLPPENTKFQVKEIEANNAGINAEGFTHIKGCEKLDRIVLNGCSYINDEALYKLELRKDSLKVLELIGCKDITDEGLRSLQVLTKLEKLVIQGLPYVKDTKKAAEDLKKYLTNCVFEIK